MTYTTMETATVPERSMLMIDGAGAPESPAFGAAVGALFATRAALGGGDVPLEGTYWQRDGGFGFDRPDDWLWILAVPAPDGMESLESALVPTASASTISRSPGWSKPSITAPTSRRPRPWPRCGPTLRLGD